MASKVFSGARAKLSIGGTAIGYVTDVAGEESVEYLPVEVLGNIYTAEFVPVAYRVSFSASRIRIVNETLKGQGLFPKHGDGSPETFLSNILAQGDLEVKIEDAYQGADGGSILMTLEGVKISSQSFTVTARGIVGTNITFLAIRMKDEYEI